MAVPLLSLGSLSLTAIVAMILIFDLVTGIALTRGKWAGYKDGLLWVIFAGLLVGIGAGTAILERAPMQLLQRLLACAIVVFAIHTIAAPAIRRRTRGERPWAIVAGLAGGVLGGMFGTPGPPLVIYLNAYTAGDKTAFRTRMLLLLLLENLFRMGLYAQRGLLARDTTLHALLLLPMLALGLWSGTYAHHRVSEKGFQRVIGGLLAASGVALFLKTLR